jgi:four helix bundle protein
MTPEEMKKRFRDFALRCVKLVFTFAKCAAGDMIGRQLTRSSTSSAANYRAACIGRSRSDFIAKLKIVEEELDESIFWIDFAPDCGLVNRQLVVDLPGEGHQLLAITVSSIKTARTR